jgi:hypothetical protein
MSEVATDYNALYTVVSVGAAFPPDILRTRYTACPSTSSP